MNDQFGQWIKCSERMPEPLFDNESLFVLICIEGKLVRSARFRQRLKAKTSKGRLPRFEHPEKTCRIMREVTHWMHLPEAPKE